MIPVSIRSEIQGEFKISYWTYDAVGHRGTERTIYQRGTLWDRRVASNVVARVVYPARPSSIFFQLCPGENDPACGTYFYDTQIGRRSKVASHRLSISPLSEPEAWSPSGAHVALAGEEDAVIVDLATGESLDVAPMLALQPPGRRARFGPWRPDGRGIVVIVTNVIEQAVPPNNLDQDLLIVYPDEKAVEYIASIAPVAWRPEDYRWQQQGSNWVLPPSLKIWRTDAAGPEGIRRKTPDELPHFKANPRHLVW